jgi:hypothetical protein
MSIIVDETSTVQLDQANLVFASNRFIFLDRQAERGIQTPSG